MDLTAVGASPARGRNPTERRGKFVERWLLALTLVAAMTTTGGSRHNARGAEPKQTGWVESSKEEPAGTHYHTFQSKTIAGEVSYLISFPPGYDDDANQNRRYPVVYWLHGLGSDQRGGADFVRNLNDAYKKGHAPAMIAVLVNGRRHSFFCDSKDGTTPVESVIVKDLIPHVDQTYRTLARREARAVEGFSMGGFGAAHLGFKFPETFGVVSILAGSLHEAEEFAEKHSEIYRDVFDADKEYFKKNSPWSLIDENRIQLRESKIRIVVGADDGLHGGNKEFHERLEKRGIDHEFDVIKGVAHNYQKLYDRMGDDAFAIYQKAFSSFGPEPK